MTKSTVSLECSHCNKTFTKETASYNNSVKDRNQKNFFCSTSCLKLSRPLKAIICECSLCGKTLTRPKHKIRKDNISKRLFCNRSCASIFNGLNRARKPKEIKKPRRIVFECVFQCTCGKTVLRTKNQLRKSKSGEAFCSKSCRMKQHNLLGITACPSFQVSSEERILFDLIQADFPELKVERNCRNILPSGLELDLFIPSLNIAIELNGPVHFFPIFGNEQFLKTKNKDIIKQMEASALGLNLIVVDISKSKSKKRTIADLTLYYNEYIKPILT